MTITRMTPREHLPSSMRVEEYAAWKGIGRGLAYKMVRRGELPIEKFGRLIRVKRDELK